MTTAKPVKHHEDRATVFLRFLLKIGLIYLSWRLFSAIMGNYHQPIDERLFPALSLAWEQANDAFRWFLVSISSWILELLGYRVTVADNLQMFIPGSNSIVVGNYCLGIQIMYLHAALIVFTPMLLKRKIKYLFTGLSLIICINILRMVILNLLSVHTPEYLDFNHYFTFRVIVFIGVLLMYYRYLSKGS